MPQSKRKLAEIAAEISKHLKRWEADPVINAQRVTVDRNGLRMAQVGPYHRPRAVAMGSRVMVTYVTFRHTSSLTRAEAEAYLAWIEAGNVGRHYEVGK